MMIKKCFLSIVLLKTGASAIIFFCLSLIGSWQAWNDSFLHVFVDKGWTLVGRAHNYKYLGGSPIDFALAKEKLGTGITEVSRINLIAVALSYEEQTQLDRQLITAVVKFFDELRKLEDTFDMRKMERLSENKIVLLKTDEGKGRKRIDKFLKPFNIGEAPQLEKPLSFTRADQDKRSRIKDKKKGNGKIELFHIHSNVPSCELSSTTHNSLKQLTRENENQQ